MPTEPVKRRKSQGENANNFCKLCGVSGSEKKIGNFQKSMKPANHVVEFSGSFAPA